MKKKLKNIKNKELTEEQKELKKLLEEKGVLDKDKPTIFYDKPFSKKEFINEVIKNKNSEIVYKNIYSLVKSCGYNRENCIKEIKKLTKSGINIHFLDENLDTLNIEQELKIGMLIGTVATYVLMEEKYKNK